jgi:hypothetical protein
VLVLLALIYPFYVFAGDVQITPYIPSTDALEGPTSPAIATSTQQVAIRVSIPKTPVMERIATCESGNNPHAKNPESTASGRFQLLRSTWNAYAYKVWGNDMDKHSVFDYNDNTVVAQSLYEEQGVTPWLSSSKCWNR